MDMDKYQELAARTNNYDCDDEGTVAIIFGVCGEAGEVADKFKKRIRDGEDDLVGIAHELGDVLWYISQLAERIGWTLDEVAQANIAKLQSRQERGVIGGNGDER